MENLLWCIPVAPLAASAVTAATGPRWLRAQSHWPCIIAAVVACLLSFWALFNVASGAYHVNLYADAPWIRISDLSIGFTFRLDALTAVMLVTVTFVGTLIAIYSIGYMRGDRGYPRYFAEIALFLAAMTGLVLADNFLLLYACWEGVGLCSYLLIGFWFQRPSASAAARKAFLVTRLGDVGLFVGLMLLWLNVPSRSLNFEDVFAWASRSADTPVVTLAALLLFLGAVGKSAQFPLHVWLPDAMEGPSPVSALIHAATMVTAGVYLVARSAPLFTAAPFAQYTVAGIGAVTALLAALIAVTQTDLKRVLAYSTISQLGYMFLALGSGLAENNLVALSVTAAVFHLFTHAFFKALLFLGAGSVMHAMGDVIDMRRFGGLRRLLPVTHWTFLCGAAALAGVPLLSGFWSKDEILLTTVNAASAPGVSTYYLILLIAGLTTAGLTAFYTFRAYFKTFWGEERIPPEAGEHPHDAPLVMAVPLMVLSVGAVVLGLIFGPSHQFAGFLEYHWMEHSFPHLLSHDSEITHAPFGAASMGLMALSSLLALAGVAIAWWMYVRAPAMPAAIAARMRGAYEISRNKFFLDEIYSALIVKPLRGLAMMCRLFDQYVVDQLVDFVARIPALAGRGLGILQNGLVQFYALLMLLGLAGLLLSLLLR